MFLLGVFTYLPLVQTSIEDGLHRSVVRIRQYFVGLDPVAVPFFPPTDPRGITKLERIGVVPTGPLQMLLTAASMVACINAIVGGVAVALALRSLLEASVPVAAVTGVVMALVFATLFFVYQVRRFQRAAAVIPELYEGEPEHARVGRARRNAGWLGSASTIVDAGRTPQRTVPKPSMPGAGQRGCARSVFTALRLSQNGRNWLGGRRCTGWSMSTRSTLLMSPGSRTCTDLTASGRGSSEAPPATWGPSCFVTPRDLAATW